MQEPSWLRYMKYVILSLLVTMIIPIYGQGSLTLSTPVIYNSVKLTNNWSPPTAVNRTNQFNGTSLGYGVSLNYTFRPTFLIKNQHLLLNVGAGYFKQRFDLRRPFDYTSPLKPIFYTDNYSYHCWQWSGGITYNYSLKKLYFLSGDLSYSWLSSFRQDYTPTSNYGYGNLTQINRNQVDFGNILILAIGLNRNLGNNVSIGFSVLSPLYTRWRNDKIFRDDTSEFSHPKFGIGSSIRATYRL